MRKILLSILIIPVSAVAQIRYEPGYFITDENSKVECLINNVEWLNNPSEFKYKLSENEDAKVASINEVFEFKVSQLKYVRAKVRMDTSEQSLKDLNKNRYPEWSEKTLFLKVLVDGKAKLYYYRNSNFTRYNRFFFSVDDQPIEQLVFREFMRDGVNLGINSFSGSNPEYRSGNTTYLYTNTMYLQQLKNSVTCGEFNLGKLQRVTYDEKALTMHFINYNACHGEQVIDQPRHSKFHLSVTPGIDFAHLQLHDEIGLVRDYPKEQFFRFGVMSEIVLPFHRNRWSVVLEPTFQQYKSEDVVNYQSVEIPLGLRHNFFMEKESSLFINGFAVCDLPMRYEVKWSALTNLTGKAPAVNLAGGVGFRWKRFSIEGRYYTWRSILDGFFKVYNKSSLILGYRIK